MRGLSKVQLVILVYLNKIITYKENVKLVEITELLETDEILKIRELVYNLDLLSHNGYIEVEKDFYTENESVAFNYGNCAVSIDLSKIKLLEKGIEKIRDYELTKKPFSEKIEFTILTYVLTFILGMMSMYIIKFV